MIYSFVFCLGVVRLDTQEAIDHRSRGENEDASCCCILRDRLGLDTQRNGNTVNEAHRSKLDGVASITAIQRC
jgi:hypothetical protein